MPTHISRIYGYICVYIHANISHKCVNTCVCINSYFLEREWIWDEGKYILYEAIYFELHAFISSFTRCLPLAGRNNIEWWWGRRERGGLTGAETQNDHNLSVTHNDHTWSDRISREIFPSSKVWGLSFAVLHLLQWAQLYCNGWQCTAVFCRALQCVPVLWQFSQLAHSVALQLMVGVAVCCSALQCIAVLCCFAVVTISSQLCVATDGGRCSALQSCAVHCSVLLFCSCYN